jgi:hypothetical protein
MSNGMISLALCFGLIGMATILSIALVLALESVSTKRRKRTRK